MNIFSRIKNYIYNLYTVKLIKKHCLASKVIIFLALASFLFTIFSVFHTEYFTDPSLITIRSIMSSIFGYLFGDNILDSSKQSSKNLYTIVASIIAILALITIMLSSLLPVEQDSAAIVEVRNTLFSSVGFLISKAKSHDVSEELEKLCAEQNKKD